MKPRFVNLYMDFARRVAQMSYAVRLKVGAVVVKNDSVISYGYNGTPAGWDNTCEDREWCSAGGWLNPDEINEEWPYEGEYTDVDGNLMSGRYRLKTKPEVLHAEMNALMKLAKNNGNANDATLFITHAPCLECAKGIYQAGISSVYFGKHYRSGAGLDFLKKVNVAVVEQA